MFTKTLFATLALSLVSAAQEEPAVISEKSPESKGDLQEMSKDAPKELTVKASPFKIETKISGILVPTKTQPLFLSPKRWKNFVIETAPQHGAEIKKGEPIIVFETESIDKILVEQKDSIKEKELNFAIANRELTELQQKNTLSLASSKRRLEHAEADLAYHETTGLPANKEELANRLQQTEDFLTYQKEELVQLLKMYEEDDITEETEEIILTRQKARVRDAKNNVKEQKRENALSLEVRFPRELISLQSTVEKARIDYATAKLNLERKFELKKLEVAKLERALTEATTALEETEADRSLLEVIAEFDGHVFYGEFIDGQWKKGKAPEFLKTGGKVPTETTFLTLVDNSSPLALHALLESEKVKEMQSALTNGEENTPKIEISPYPNLAGKHLVALEAKPAEPFQFPAQKDEAELVFYQVEEAISIPNSVVKTREDGTSYVMLKLSEGDSEEREVQLGKNNGDLVEILSGLEEGQVILP